MTALFLVYLHVREREREREREKYCGLSSSRIFFSDLNSTVLLMKLTSFLSTVLTTYEQCLLGLRFLLTVTYVFFLSNLRNFGVIHCIFYIMIIVPDIQ